MTRRHFIATTGLATAATRGYASEMHPKPQHPSASSSPPLPSFEFAEWTLDRIQGAMSRGELDSLTLTRQYLERIKATHNPSTHLHAILEVNPEALELARQRDAERKDRGPRGPLHGIPVVVKDNLDTGDAMQTTAGSLALVGTPAARDAFAVARLREAGAVILGKANLSEWANFRSSRSISGWSGRGGLTRNPYALDRSALGSSSGSAAAVSANLAAVAIGTETDGSIVSPASCCGVVGLKPTVGWISRSGIIPISASQDTAGPMTRTVRDAALLMNVLVAVDPADAATRVAGRPSNPDFTAHLRPEALRGARIGVARDLFPRHPAVQPAWSAALDALKAAGAVLVDPVPIPDLGALHEAKYGVMLYEFKAGLNTYLNQRKPEPPIRNLADLIAFNQRHADTELNLFDQDILEEAESKGPLTDAAYLRARAECLRIARTEGLDLLMERERLDAVVAPTTGPAHVLDLLLGDRWLGGSSTLAAVAGYPNITVPCAMVGGLPVGFSFFGKAWSDARLLGLAYAFEQETRARRTPGLLPTLNPA